MRQSVINYVKENGIKLAANSKALKLINNGAMERYFCSVKNQKRVNLTG